MPLPSPPTKAQSSLLELARHPCPSNAPLFPGLACYPSQEIGAKESSYLLGAWEPAVVTPPGLFVEASDPGRACLRKLRALSFSLLPPCTSEKFLLKAALPPAEEGGELTTWSLAAGALLIEGPESPKPDWKNFSRACCVLAAKVIQGGDAALSR